MASLHRFHVDDLTPAEVVLTEAEAHHAAHVLRLRAGGEVELFDGRGGRASGRIASMGRGEVVVAVEHRQAPRPQPRPAVHVAFAVPKGKRLDWLLEKATELGAASLQPVIFHRSVAGGEELGDAKRQRWLSHCVAAAKQSGLDFLPELRDPVPLAEVLAASSGQMALMGSPDADAAPLPAALAGLKDDQDVLLLVGPEGGLTDEERKAAAAAGVAPVRLGDTVLRIETAAIALLAAIIAFVRR